MAETSTGDATAGAVLDEAESRDWGTSQEDVEAYAAAGGAAAGAAACAAVGAAPAAPLCATVAGWAAEFIAGTIYEWCTSSEEAERARQRRQEVRRLHNRIDQIGDWQRLNGQMLEERIAALRELHSQLWPSDPWVENSPSVIPQQREVYPAIMLLSRFGMETEPREFGDQVAMGLPDLDAEWERLRPEMSDATLFEMLQEQAVGISESIERAYDRAVIDLTAQGAGDSAERRARVPNIRTVRPAGRMSAFGATAGVEPVGPGRVVVPAGNRSLVGGAVRVGAFVAIAGAAAGIGAWRSRRA